MIANDQPFAQEKSFNACVNQDISPIACNSPGDDDTTDEPDVESQFEEKLQHLTSGLLPNDLTQFIRESLQILVNVHDELALSAFIKKLKLRIGEIDSSYPKYSEKQLRQEFDKIVANAQAVDEDAHPE